MLRGTVTDRIIRVLDTTNKTEEEAEGMVCRLLGELRRSGYDKRILESSVERVKMDAWGGLRSARSFVNCSYDKNEKWCTEYAALMVGCDKLSLIHAMSERRRTR